MYIATLENNSTAKFVNSTCTCIIILLFTMCCIVQCGNNNSNCILLMYKQYCELWDSITIFKLSVLISKPIDIHIANMFNAHIYVRKSILLLLCICIIKCGIIVGINQENYGFHISALVTTTLNKLLLKMTTLMHLYGCNNEASLPNTVKNEMVIKNQNIPIFHLPACHKTWLC